MLFTASYHFYQEIDADAGIRSAGLDEFDFLGLTIGPDTGPFVRYARGQLPFDQRDQDVFELGLEPTSRRSGRSFWSRRRGTNE